MARPRDLLVFSLLGLGVGACIDPEGDEAWDILTTAPGPFFYMSDSRPVTDWLVTVRSSPESFPPDGAYSELFEIEMELDGEPTRIGRNPPSVIGRIGQVSEDGRSILSSTVARTVADDLAYLHILDRQGSSFCGPEYCQRQYVVRFVLLGLAVFRPEWQVTAAVDWEREDPAIPEEAAISFRFELF